MKRFPPARVAVQLGSTPAVCGGGGCVTRPARSRSRGGCRPPLLFRIARERFMPSLDRHVRGRRQAARLDASVYPRQTGVPVIQACPPCAYSRPRPPLVESVLRRPVHRRFVPALRSANPDGRRRCNLWFREFRVRAGDSPGRRRCRAEDSPYGRAYRLGCWARRQPAVAVSAAEFAGQFPSQNRPMNFRRLSFRVTGMPSA